MRKVLMIILLLVPALTRGQGWVTTPADSLLAERIIAGLKATVSKDPGAVIGDLMVQAGKALEGQAYVAGTLDGEPGERLRIYLTRTDCILFVETCLAMARTAVRGGGFETLADEIRQSRYRGGHAGAYADRLHYTTEWGMQGEQRGTLKDITKELGGVAREHTINYMSAHPESYPLMDDVAAIRKAEDRINSVKHYYIPKNQLDNALKGMRSGDIICLVTSTKGLDISHVMMAVVGSDGTVRPLHASTGPMKVVMDTRTLQEYLAARSSVVGIQVLRPL